MNKQEFIIKVAQESIRGTADLIRTIDNALSDDGRISVWESLNLTQDTTDIIAELIPLIQEIQQSNYTVTEIAKGLRIIHDKLEEDVISCQTVNSLSIKT